MNTQEERIQELEKEVIILQSSINKLVKLITGEQIPSNVGLIYQIPDPDYVEEFLNNPKTKKSPAGVPYQVCDKGLLFLDTSILRCNVIQQPTNLDNTNMKEESLKFLKDFAKGAKEQGQKLVDITDQMEHKDYGDLVFHVNDKGLLFESNFQIPCVVNGYKGNPFEHKRVDLSVKNKSRFTKLKMTNIIHTWILENIGRVITSDTLFKLILEEDDKE